MTKEEIMKKIQATPPEAPAKQKPAPKKAPARKSNYGEFI